jgi:hypothetical protein
MNARAYPCSQVADQRVWREKVLTVRALEARARIPADTSTRHHHPAVEHVTRARIEVHARTQCQCDGHSG